MLLQDLKIHRNEIHSKLVAIMRERLTVEPQAAAQHCGHLGHGAPGPQAALRLCADQRQAAAHPLPGKLCSAHTLLPFCSASSL